MSTTDLSQESEGVVNRTVVIDAFVEQCTRPLQGYATVAVDVIRASTTAVTAVSLGRQCFPVPSLDAALKLKQRMPDALLAGETGGDMPKGFDITNSPSDIAARNDIARRMILLSSSGTRLMDRLATNGSAYVACFRNQEATARYLAAHHKRVAVFGAVTRGDFREEDQMCCAWIAEALMASGFRAEDDRTLHLIQQWSGAPPDAFLPSKSVKYLRDTGQERDLGFVLSHFNDLNAAFALRRGGIVKISRPEAQSFPRQDPLLEQDAISNS